MSRIPILIFVSFALTATVPALGEVTDDDIDAARKEVNTLLADSQELGRQVQDAWARQLALEYEISRLEGSIEFARASIAAAEQRLEEVAVELYMGTASATSVQVLFSASDEEYAAGVEYLRALSGDETDVIGQLRVFRAELARQTERIAAATAEQAQVAEDLQLMATELQEELIAAQAVYDTLVAQQRAEEEARLRAEEEARQRAAEEAARNATTTTTTTVATATETTSPTTTTTTIVATTTTTAETTTTTEPPSTTGGGTCPVAGAVSFTDTYGAPRSGGRTHQGVDMIAARGTPLVAIYEGTIKRISTSALGGLTLWLRSDSGDEFYYAHLEGYGDISVGQHVPEGYVVGYNGSSGNAPEWLPHLHFEYHPGGGSAVNPYALVKVICG